MKNVLLIFLQILLLAGGWREALASDACSRTAVVNYQEILVDTSSNRKGEGLRFYLEKDPVAKSYLEEYQDRTSPGFLGTALSTIGVGFILAGVMVPSSNEPQYKKGKNILLIGGASLIAMNFLINATYSYNNEVYLEKAIEEYNKKNLPRIYFTPFKNTPEKGRNPSGNWGLWGEVSKDF